MLTTTLNEIRKHSPCEDGWKKLLFHLGKAKADDMPVSFETILESNGLDDALWCLYVLPNEYDNAVRLLACDFAESALKYVPYGEGRPRKAIEVARRYADGNASREELAAAMAAALDAAWDAEWAAARAAAWDAACDACNAACNAARAAARSAARSAARAAARAAACDACDAEWAAAWAAACDAQTETFKRWLASQ